MKLGFLSFSLSLLLAAELHAMDPCELAASKRNLGDSLLELRESIGLKELDVCNSHKLYDVREPKTLLSRSIVDYAEVQFSPSRTKVGWIESQYTGPGEYQGLLYRLVVYDLESRERRVAKESEKQLHQFKWASDTALQYSFEYRGIGEKGWFEVTLPPEEGK